MLIPTAVDSYATLAVPGTDYWCGTAAHYYINPPGVGTGAACVWGSNGNPFGNWSPYVAGANVDNSGNTFIKLGWNPIYLEPTTPFRNNMPTWGVKIDCPNGGCNGLPCAIDPSQNGVNQMHGGASSGAGGGNFCVVTVPKGVTANFVVFNSGGSQDDNPGQFYQSSSAPAPTSSSAPATSAASSWQDWAHQSKSSTTSSAVWSSSASSSSAAYSSYSWSVSNSTASYNHTTAAHGPSGPPSYTLFGGPTSTAASEASYTASPTVAAPSIQSVTGAASLNNVPAVGFVSSLLMGLAAFL